MVLGEANSLVLAKLALAEFGFDPETVPLTFVKMRENTVFRADAPGGAIALRMALEYDPRALDQIPSTKGCL